MKYNLKLKAAVIPIDTLDRVGGLLLDTLAAIRAAYNLPLDKYELQGGLGQADHAQRDVIEIAEQLGIELGARWGNEIDLRDRVH